MFQHFSNFHVCRKKLGKKKCERINRRNTKKRLMAKALRPSCIETNVTPLLLSRTVRRDVPLTNRVAAKRQRLDDEGSSPSLQYGFH